MLADRTGLTQGLSAMLAKPGFHPVHDRGRVLTDMACSIAAGGVDLYDIEALRSQCEVFGPVAADTTALHALGQIVTSTCTASISGGLSPERTCGVSCPMGCRSPATPAVGAWAPRSTPPANRPR